MPEESTKAKDELKTHWGLKEKILFSLQKQKLSVISKKGFGCVHTYIGTQGKGRMKECQV